MKKVPGLQETVLGIEGFKRRFWVSEGFKRRFWVTEGFKRRFWVSWASSDGYVLLFPGLSEDVLTSQGCGCCPRVMYIRECRVRPWKADIGHFGTLLCK